MESSKKEEIDFIKKHFFDEELINTEEGPSGVEIGFVEDDFCIKLVAFFMPVVDPDKAHPAYNGHTVILSCMIIDKKFSKEFSALVEYLHGNNDVKDLVDSIYLGKWGYLFKGLSRREVMTKLKEMILENTSISVSKNHPGDITISARSVSLDISDDELGMISSTYEKCFMRLAKYVLAFPANRWADVAAANIKEMIMEQMSPRMPDDLKDKIEDAQAIFCRDTLYQLIAIADAISLAVSQWDAWKVFIKMFPEHWISQAHHNYAEVVGEDVVVVDPMNIVTSGVITSTAQNYSGTH